MSEKTPKKFSMAGGGAVLLSSNMLFAVISLLTGIIVARWLGKEGRGLLALYVTTPGLLCLFGNLGMGGAVTYHVGRKSHPLDVIVGNALGSGIVSAVVAGLVLFAIQPPWSEYWTGLPQWALWMMIPLTFAAYAQNITDRMHSANFHVHYSCAGQMTHGVVKLIGLTTLVVWLQWGLTGALIVSTVEIFAAFLASLILLWRYVPVSIRFDPKILGPFILYGIQNWLFVFFANASLKSGIYLLKHYEDDAAVGLFSTGLALTVFLQMVPDAWVRLLLPSVAGGPVDQVSQKTLKLCRNGLFSLVVLGAAFAVVAPWIVPLLYSKEFGSSVYVIWAMTPGLVFQHVYRTLCIDFAGRNRQMPATISSFVGLAVNIGLSMVWIPSHEWYGGIVGAGLAYTVASAVMAGMLLIQYLRAWHVPVREVLIITGDDIRSYREKLARWRERRRGSSETPS